MTTTRVFIEEVRDVMDKPGDDYQWAFLRLLLEAFPADNNEVVRVRRPVKMLLCLPEFLQLHRELTFADLVIREDLVMSNVRLDRY
jgi:hypothetical protein